MTDDHLLNSVADLFAILPSLTQCNTELSLKAGLIHTQIFIHLQCVNECVKLHDAVKLCNNKTFNFSVGLPQVPIN